MLVASDDGREDGVKKQGNYGLRQTDTSFISFSSTGQVGNFAPERKPEGGIKGQEWLMAKVSSVRGKKQNISRFIAACHRGDEG